MFNIHKNTQRGFTLIEMMVTIVIFSFFTSMYVFQGRAGQSRIVTDDTAYKVALSIREVQNYGISVKEYKGVGASAGTFNAGYGINFSKNEYKDQNAKYFTFVDLNDNGWYDDPNSSVPDAIVETYTLGNGEVVEICVLDSALATNYSCGATQLTVAFKRPNPEALLRSTADGVNPIVAQVRIDFPGNISRYIRIQYNGQIDVSNTTLISIPQSATAKGNKAQKLWAELEAS